MLTTLALTAALVCAPGGEVAWETGALSNAIGKARHQQKPVLVYFWMDGSDYCKKLFEETLSDERAAKVLEGFVCYSADHGTRQGASLVEQYRVQTLPTMLFLLPDGSPEDLIGGYIAPEAFVEELGRIRRGENTVSDLRRKAAEATKKTDGDFEARYTLADRLRALGQEDEYRQIVDSIRTDDPKGKSLTGARILLSDVVERIVAEGGGDEHIADWDLEPLRKHLSKVKHDELRYDGWMQLGNIEAGRSNVAGACEAFEVAWEYVEEDNAMGWTHDVAMYVLEADGERTAKEKKLALALATSAAELAEAFEGCSAECECDTCSDMDGFLASHLATLARAQHLNGHTKKAKKVVKRCIDLDPDGEYERLLESFDEKKG